ncbi:sensor histidine kinase [Nonomuraea wenchangensis]|uniref:histidine kinase n=1 Tax=Nonomuraea wenchangensis TaxID=568860 RepID=A0A1I0LVL7_9ACTN|nr:sensor histidine kinase [Nonomuraea wenchangensis]SEU47900.1 Signal transduction histidine kinase [Nonomuraea wenchangensis]
MAEPSPRREPAPVRHLARITDITLAVLTLVFFVTVALATGVHSPWRGPIPLGLLLGGLLLFRRRWPMTVLLLSIGGIFVYHLTVHWSPAGWIWPAAVAYFTAATTSRVRWVSAIGLAQLVYSAIDARGILEFNPVRYVFHVAGEGLLLAILIGAGLTYAAAARWRGRLRETDSRAHAAEERLRVSHEVHDVIAHTLAVVGVQLNVAADALEEDPAAAAAALRVAKDVRNRAMTDLRSLIAILRDIPGDTTPQADLASLDTLIADARTAGLEVTLHEQGDRAAVPAITAIAIYRVVQESLANTLKHAGARKAEVTIGYRPRSITVEIVDDGRGVPDGVTEGHGLAGMRERVSALGGALTAGPVPGGGFAVRADIPVAGSTA